jgi:molecular chaperone GrpE
MGIDMSKKSEKNNQETVEAAKLEEKENINNGEVNSLKAQLIRVNADFDNFKKRITKERSEWESFAQINIIEEFLPFIDDYERALQTAQKDGKKDGLAWLQGFEIIYKNLKKTLDRMGVKEVDCSSNFDPEFHEALMEVESKDHKEGQIVQVLNKGYLFKDKVIRHAKVSVAK